MKLSWICTAVAGIVVTGLASIIRANAFSLFHHSHTHDHIVFWPTWNRLNIGVSEVDLDIPEHRLAVSYGRVLMFFKSSIRCEDDTFQEESLAYTTRGS